MGTKQFNDKTTHQQQANLVLRQGSYGNGKTEFQGFSRTFSFFKDSFLYNTTFKSALFQSEASKCKGALDIFDSDTGDKNRDYHTN